MIMQCKEIKINFHLFFNPSRRGSRRAGVKRVRVQMGDFFGRSGSGEGGFESPNLDEIVQDIFQIREGTGRNRHHRHHSNVRSAISSCSSSNTPSSEEEIGSPTTDVRRQSVPFMAREQRPRPQVTLRYVQTLDGSLVASDTEALRIDNPDSMTLINRYLMIVAVFLTPRVDYGRIMMRS